MEQIGVQQETEKVEQQEQEIELGDFVMDLFTNAHSFLQQKNQTNGFVGNECQAFKSFLQSNKKDTTQFKRFMNTRPDLKRQFILLQACLETANNVAVDLHNELSGGYQQSYCENIKTLATQPKEEKEAFFRRSLDANEELEISYENQKKRRTHNYAGNYSSINS